MSVLNEVNIESGTVEVEVYTKTEAALSALRIKYKDIPDCGTEDGYNAVKDGVKELTTYRTTLDKERKRIKQPYLDAGKIIDAEAKRITAALVEIETPLKEAKQEADEREAKKKAERIARLQVKIDNIKAYANLARSHNANAVAEMIATVDAIDTANDFYDLTYEATVARTDTLERLNEIYMDKLGQERAAAAAKEAAAAAKAAQEEADELRRQLAEANAAAAAKEVVAAPAVMEEVMADRQTHGIGIVRDGQRIPPEDFFDAHVDLGMGDETVVDTFEYVSELSNKIDLWGRVHRIDSNAIVELKRVLSDYVEI